MRAQSAPFGDGTAQPYTLEGVPTGTYQIVCMAPDYREAGLTATLHVR